MAVDFPVLERRTVSGGKPQSFLWLSSDECLVGRRARKRAGEAVTVVDVEGDERSGLAGSGPSRIEVVSGSQRVVVGGSAHSLLSGGRAVSGLSLVLRLELLGISVWSSEPLIVDLVLDDGLAIGAAGGSPDASVSAPAGEVACWLAGGDLSNSPLVQRSGDLLAIAAARGAVTIDGGLRLRPWVSEGFAVLEWLTRASQATTLR